MKLTYADSQVAIDDDVLSAADFTALWTELPHVSYKRVHAHAQQGIWRLQDGDPLQGPTIAYSAIPADQLVGAGGLGIGLYPTHTALDPALAAVVATTPEVSALIGDQGTDWLVLTVTAAGDNVRASVGGFFVNATGIAGFLSALQR